MEKELRGNFFLANCVCDFRLFSLFFLINREMDHCRSVIYSHPSYIYVGFATKTSSASCTVFLSPPISKGCCYISLILPVCAIRQLASSVSVCGTNFNVMFLVLEPPNPPQKKIKNKTPTPLRTRTTKCPMEKPSRKL